jgi:hypothetical protein
MTISDGDADRLRRLQAAAHEEYQRIAAMPRPAQHEYYRALIEISESGASLADIGGVLGVHRSRVGQLLSRARAVESGLNTSE